jgi:outer membrane protein TolC
MNQLSFLKRMHGVTVVWLLLLSFGGVLTADTMSLTYEDLGSLIRAKNGSIQSSLTAIDHAKIRTDFLKRSFSPQLSAMIGSEGFYNKGIGESRVQPLGSLYMSVNIFRGGQDQQEESIRQNQVVLSEVQLKKAVALELMTAQWLYWELAYLDEVIRNEKDILSHNAKSYDSARLRFKRGLLPQSDVMGFLLYKGMLDEAIESAEHEKKIVMLHLLAILGLPDTTVVQFTTTLPHHHDDTLIMDKISIETIPELQELQLTTKMAELQKSKLASKKKPSVDVFGSYTLYPESERTYPNLEDRAETVVGVRAQFLILDAKLTQNEMKALDLKLKSQAELIAYKQRVVASEIKGFQEELIHLHELIHRSESRVSQAKEFLNQIFLDYDHGIKDSTAVISAIQQYQDIQEAYATQRKDYHQVKSKILSLLAVE